MAEPVKDYDKVTFGWVTQTYVNSRVTGQSFFAGDEVRYEDNMGDPVDADTESEQYNGFDMVQPLPTEIDFVVRQGGLDISEKQDVDDVFDQCAVVMDDVNRHLDTPYFSAGGVYYTIELRPVIVEPPLEVIERVLDNRLADYRCQSEESSDTVGVDAELTKIALIKDDKERVDAKMAICRRFAELKARLVDVKERARNEKAT